MRLVLAILIFYKLSFGNPYEDALALFRSDFVDNFDSEKTMQTIEKNRRFAISSYLALKSASYLYFSGSIEEGKKFMQFVDEKALGKEDIPFFLYLKQLLEGNKENRDSLKRLVLNYPESYYGYKVLLENTDLFKEEEKVQILESLIRKKMRERATFLLFTLSDQEAILYIRLLLSTSPKERKTIFESIPPESKYYLKALRQMAETDRDYEDSFLKALSQNLDEYEKSILNFATKSFYRGEDISKYISLIPDSSPYFPALRWLEFLSHYRAGNYSKALEILLKHSDKFERDTANYWLYLVYTKIGDESKAQKHLSLINSYQPENPSQLTYYRALLDFKEGRSYRFQENELGYTEKDVVKTLSTLKKYDYKMAYLEGVYLTKNGMCAEVYNTLMEVGVKCFDRNSLYTYIKPFGKIREIDENLVYSIIRQESFFDPFAISPSNAVGITQFIPKTAAQFAKKLNLYDFDITHLFNPELAIKFCVEYLSYLDKLWKGNEIYMIASYNAGENAVKKFLENNKIEDPAEFIEFFPYKETRDYVKNVIRNYVIYKGLE